MVMKRQYPKSGAWSPRGIALSEIGSAIARIVPAVVGLVSGRRARAGEDPATIENRDPDRLPRRVLVMNWRDPWHPEAGGAEVMLHEHIKRWHEQGHDITVFTAHYPGAPHEEVRDGLRIVRRGGRFSVYLWAPVTYLLRLRRTIDAVLDIENGIPFFTPLYSRKPRLCLVHHVHRDQFLWEFGPLVGRVGRFMECVLMPLIYHRTRFLAVSESTRRELADIGIPAERCRVVHNGLDHGAYHKVVKRSAAPRLLYVGRLKRHKRVDLIIDLCARLQADAPDLVLDIVGTGDDEERLRALIAARGLENVVRFHGFVSHSRKVALYSRAWALLTATEREGWGLSIIEAAACGTPSLCLDVPGVRDAVEHGASGWLAPDMDGLYEATRRFLRDAAWRQRLSEGAQERAQLFSWRTSAAGAREALVEAWLAEKRIPLRRTFEVVDRQNVVLQRNDIPESVWPVALRSVRERLRFGDEVHLRDDVIHIGVAVSSAAELDALKNRMDGVLDRFAQADARQVNHQELAVASA